MMRLLLLLVTLWVGVNCDVNMHNVRGSNNRLNENTRERANANRLFDSQNNNRGGHNVGELSGKMVYYAGSKVQLQWANQHSCSDENNNCEVVLQYMCGKNVRDGTVTTTIPTNQKTCKNADCDTDEKYGMHENWRYYQECVGRNRNRGLFTANQAVKNSAKTTRQNAAGTRRGYECPEERDYYPYWYPTPWRDIAVFTNDVKRCKFYQSESENVKGRGYCKFPDEYWQTFTDVGAIPAKVPLRQLTCKNTVVVGANKKQYRGVWTLAEAHGFAPPECLQSQWTRDNHQGNTMGGQFSEYNWTIPKTVDEGNCIIRIRYNISTEDFPGWDADQTYDENLANGKQKYYPSNIFTRIGLSDEDAKARGYYFTNDPTVDVFKTNRFRVRLALATNQYGRTFQDRSHRVQIRQRPSSMDPNATIYNINVRGKRGNIVQVYPSTEYDFVPNLLNAKVGEYVHIQWTGSDRNPANNAGEGTAGTDRSNVVQLAKHFNGSIESRFSTSYPDLELSSKNSFLGLSRQQDLHQLAFGCTGKSPLLNDKPSYFSSYLLKMEKVGTWYYMCTRNNNFSNRSQKGKIVVQEAKPGKK